MESNEESPSARTAAQRRAEIRRRKLLMNSEDRINKIVGFSKADADGSSARSVIEPRFHLDLVRNEPWSSSASSKRLSPHVTETAVNSSETSERNGSSDAVGEDDVSPLRPRPHGELLGDELTRSPRRGLHKYLSRFDDAMKLRGHLAIEKAAQESSVESEEFDSFCLFRLLGSVALAIFVRIFVCQYLSIFAPFLTLELGFMGLNKYFPKVEKKTQTTMLTAALLLSGIPAEVINRSMDTYRRMSDVFSDLCVYFFTFVICHELLMLFDSQMS
ncbi:guided entry of tail-anchored proteins factor CAMLG-like isoform X3 [Myxocyprinus asiaticus]|uniref:guided entry of tail-anchored proteins factor CAMLG-like isoform X3 n=1 Tax=Myxocyprinus asiaticus TaxID=70543 RepID=UPI0022230FFE|nr:guided entry of tail-anchored proteins factor CAMLG-like isoform X3 [Myxocyprinus asiaticus]